MADGEIIHAMVVMPLMSEASVAIRKARGGDLHLSNPEPRTLAEKNLKLTLLKR